MQQIKELLLDETNIAFHPMVGSSYQLNDIGMKILQLLKEDNTKEEVIESLHHEYGTSKDDLFIDVSDFMTKLKIYGLTQ